MSVSDDDLKQLRNKCGDAPICKMTVHYCLNQAKADVLALLDEIERLRAVETTVDKMQDQTASQGNYIEELEAKLAKAVAALEDVKDHCSECGDRTRQTLKEIGE